jgi:predicted Na+-dependent transporter
MALVCKEAPKVLIGLVVYTAVATALPMLKSAKGGLFMIFAAALLLHCSLVSLNYLMGRRSRMSEPDLKSFTIVSSQKTLPLSLFICLNHLGHLPLAPIAPLAYHLLQIPLDTVAAHLWRGRGEAGKSGRDET